jgi:hypothetical protein
MEFRLCNLVVLFYTKLCVCSEEQRGYATEILFEHIMVVMILHSVGHTWVGIVLINYL